MTGIGVIICVLWFTYVINMYYEGYTKMKNNKELSHTKVEYNNTNCLIIPINEPDEED